MYDKEPEINGEKYVTLTILKKRFNLLSLEIEAIRKQHNVPMVDWSYVKEGQVTGPNIRYYHMKAFEKAHEKHQKID
ncbi:hypothetical protein Amet_4654 [Alkaliphilus metalliredigens QYMF]|uniref:Uncharacterized protein n=1 Tax=Alkaliphilus metalliredigens (strain QYMF) TaxID=293826 RepID=A6TX06_ALKMQ|nr:hypothetical protein [Alkaliphilus metalliredigens]ABR50724.1 hypothetical protein Amet_4654 [Alkaliphilus metalliredigens QYMF]